MLDQTLKAIDERLYSLELQLGIDQSSDPQERLRSSILPSDHVDSRPIVDEIAELQTKLRQILRLDEKLNTIPSIISEYRSLIDPVGLLGIAPESKPEDVPQNEKQERISARLPTIMKYMNEMVELANMEMPEMPTGLLDRLDMASLLRNDARTQKLAQLYELLAVKNMLVIHKFTELTRKESEYWAAVDAKLRNLSLQVFNVSGASGI